jgi:preprotein translocase subunit YajC
MNLAPFFLLAESTPASKPADPGLQSMNMMVLMMFVIVVVYIVSIRPQAKKQKELQARVASLKTGDRVVTTGGIHGTVANVKDGATLLLRIADNVKIEIDKTSIATVISPEPAKTEASAVSAKS